MPPPRAPKSSHASPIHIGIDPGVSGGVASLQGRFVCKLSFSETPHTWASWLRDRMSERTGDPNCVWPIFATVEKVHAMPGQGVTSMFTFGKAAGLIEGMLVAFGIPYQTVPPHTWQKALGIPPREKAETPTQWKNRLKAFAQRLFPQEHITKATADALLIAEYARRTAERYK